MLSKFALLALPLALAAAPAAAQSLSDTHQMRWAPAGKTTPLVSYHPIKRSCASAPLHLSGKTPHMTAAPICAKSDTKTEVAARD
ncbi:hypothetical protein [Sphingomonas sp. BAUL-RG-20F-R05-02]|uniref:hypothetical protein n=1 Tax=Sphingomonas sp. BAUL-RG-20F-R05-02 TaxID=2914830 RepID=UPI001F56EBA9|nr:hypothetical protein [Sphingomonas sp. BAUL-RG-20F-R05-02]